jgi:hypothetical protein
VAIHIAERPVVPIGQPNTAGSIWVNTDVSYDAAIAGVPFMFATNDKFPYKRATAPYRKNQTDTQKEPGEQSITGWWLRSQSSFHYGAGLRFQEPLAGDNVQYRFQKSAGVDVFNAGQVTLLPDMTQIKTAVNAPIMIPASYNGVDMTYIADGANLFMYDGTTTTPVTWGGTGNILDLTQDGVYYYAGNATGIYRGLLSGGAGSLIFQNPTTATTIKLGYAKQRVIAGINNSVFEVIPISSLTVTAASLVNNVATLQTTVAHNLNIGYQITISGLSAAYNGTYVITSIPSANTFTYNHNNADQAFANGLTGTMVMASNNSTPIYTHPATSWKWTGICDGPNAIYIAGYAGVSGGIFRLALDTTGAVPLLNKALTAADMPQGEYVTCLGSYLGKYLIIGTNRGVRVGQIDTSGWLSSGYITYGPLSVITSGWDPGQGKVLNGSPVTSVSFQDRFAYCAVTNYIDNGDGTYCSGLIKIDLSKEVGPNQFAWATDRRVSTITANASAVCSLGTTNSLMIAYTGVGIYRQSNTLVPSGYLQTGQIRYFTLEDKHFELLKLRVDPTQAGQLGVYVVNQDQQTIRSVISVDQTFDYSQDITAIDSLDTSPQSSMGLRFVLTAGAGQQVGSEDRFLGYQLKATPAVKRQRLISLPLMNYDFIQDRNNNITGSINASYARLQLLEAIESNGDVVIYQDLTTGEQQRCIIEEQQYSRVTAPDRAFSGDGGVIYCTIRTVS